MRRSQSAKGPSRGQVPLFSERPSRTPEPPRRPMPLRARRRRVRVLIALGVVILLGALCFGVSWLSYLPRFNISSISVSGAENISEELITRSIETVLDDGAYHILSRRNVLFYPHESLETKLVSSFPLIKSVDITRPSLLSTNMLVTIEEREPFARWCLPAQAGAEDQRCYFMDEGGFIYASVGEFDESVPQMTPSTAYVFSGSIASSTDPIGQSFVRAHLPGLLSLLKFLGQASFTPLGAHVENDQDILVRLKEGFVLKASFGADANTLVKNFELVLSSDVLQGKQDILEYVDLRFGNRVYYKLKGHEQQSTE